MNQDRLLLYVQGDGNERTKSAVQRPLHHHLTTCGVGHMFPHIHV